MTDKLLKNHMNRLAILTSALILGMFGANLLFTNPVSADWFSQINDHYTVRQNGGYFLYWNGKNSQWTIIDSSPFPQVHFNGNACDEADSDLNFTGSKTYNNCIGLTVSDHNRSTFFNEGSLAYRIADFDSHEIANTTGGRISSTYVGSLSKVTISNGGRTATSASDGCPGGNPNKTEDCSILVQFNYGYNLTDGGGFNFNVHDNGTYLHSLHEYYYDAPSLGEYRTLTFHPNGGSVTDATDGTALLLHTSGANALREYDQGKTAKNFSTPPTRSDGYTFAGWYYSNGTRSDPTVVMSGNVDLWAHWTQPITWTVTPKISINMLTASPGQTVSWTHSVTNNGPNNTDKSVSYYWQNSGYLGTDAGGGGVIPSGFVATTTKPSPASTSSHLVTQDDVNQNLCRSTVASPKAWNDSSTISVKACAFVPYNYTLTPYVSIDNKVIDAGQEVNIKQWVDNSGTTESEIATWALTRKVNSGSANTLLTGSQVFPISTTTLTNHADSDTNFNVGDHICYVLTVNPHSNSDSGSKASNPSIPPSPPAVCVVIGKKPKTQVWGGDLFVGGFVKASQSVKNSSLFGSWSEYGILAGKTITGAGSGAAFANGGLADGGSTSACKYSNLSFANTPSGSSCSGTGIGNYTNMPTIPNVEASFPGGLAMPATTTTSISSGIYTAGDITLEAGNLDLGKSVIIKSTGTVRINGNQTYNPGPYTSISQIPQLVIIANKIIINNNTTQVDAWLIAKNDNKSGEIYTCEVVGDKSDKCNQQLIVNGPVMTNKLYLYRTFGATADKPGDPAEIFNLRADAYLWSMNRAISSGRIQTVYTTELPPRL